MLSNDASKLRRGLNMGLFSRKVPQDEIIKINRPTEKKKEVEPVDKKDKNEISEWAPVVCYTGAEITSTGEMYRDPFENNDILSEIKTAGWSNVDSNSFAVHERHLVDFNLSRTEKRRYYNVIVEGIGQNVVISNSINTRNSEQKHAKYASNTEAMILMQTILICGVCYSIPLFPNEIVGFYTEERRLNFVCDGCSDTVCKFHSVDQLHENNLSYFRDAKIVKSMKEFTPTTLLTDYDGVKRPQITKVLPIDRSLIKPGEENDLRTKVEKTDLQKNLEININNGTNTDTDIVSENSATDMNGANADSSDETQREMVGKDKAAELEKVLNELNSINDDSTNVHKIFAKDKDTNSTLQKLKQ